MDSTGELRQRLDEMEQRLKQLTQRDFNYHVTIEDVHIHRFVLDQLTFRLDALDIHDVSGALNLGNNFGVRVEAKRPKRTSSSANPSTDEREDKALASCDVRKTATGYAFTFGSE